MNKMASVETTDGVGGDLARDQQGEVRRALQERQMNLHEARRLNCLSHWHPIIESVVPTPKTTIIRTGIDILLLMDEKEPEGFGGLVEEISAAGDAMGYPFFLRTGQTSGKHDWDETCCVRKREDVAKHVFNLVYHSCCVDFVGLPCDVWAVREMLPIKPVFVGVKGMPVCREFRLFAKDGNVRCMHEYWPKDAVQMYCRLPDGWEKSYDDMTVFKDDVKGLPEVIDLASMASKAVGGDWSIDVLHTDRGWFVTDMALAGMSFHMPGCDKENHDGNQAS